MLIASGETILGTIGVAGEVDEYTFAATAGESVVAGVMETTEGSSLSPRIQLLAPGGASLFSVTGVTGNGGTAFNLAASGTYTLRVSDNGAQTGGYAVSLAKLAGDQANSGDGGPVASGEYGSGTISLADIDIYTINATANTTLAAAAGELTSQAMNLQMAVFSPAGANLFNASATDVVGTTQTLLPTTGTYYVVVWDAGFNATGTYNLTIASAPAVQSVDADSGALSSGIRRAGALAAADIDVYTITANTSGILLVNLSEENAPPSAFGVSLQIVSPTGQLVYNSSGTVSRQTLISPTTSGVYTILVSDNFFDAVGNYALTAVSVPGSQPVDADSGPITSGQYRSGTLDAGDLDVYTLNVNLGSSFLAVLAESSTASTSPQMTIVNPNGAVVFNNSGTIGVQHLESNVAVGGTYTFIVADTAGDDVGPYNMTVVAGSGTQSIDADSAPLSFAEYRRGELDMGDIDVYTLSGTQTSSLLYAMDESEFLGASATAELGVVVFRPDGSVLASPTTTTGTAAISNNLPATGTYTIAIYESGADEKQMYGFTAVSLAATASAVGDGGPLTSGVTVRGKLDYGDIDAHFFTAAAGQTMVLSIADVDGGAFSPSIVVAAPDGTLNINTASAEGVLHVTALVAGVYKVFVLDQGGNDYGEYAMTVGLSSNGTQPTAGDSGPLTTTPRDGELGVGDLDIFTVAATAGVNFSITLNETPSAQAIQPRIFVFRPDGTQQSASNVTNALTVNVTSVVGGTYTIVVVENGVDLTGSYSIAQGSVANTLDTTPPRIVEAEYRYDRPAPELILFASEIVSASLQTGDITLLNTTTGATVPNEALSLAYAGTTNRILISTPGLPGGILPDGIYVLTLSGPGIADTSGNQLDGNSNGVGGDNYTFSFFVLAGDANRDGSVAFDDLLILAQNYGRVGVSFSQGNVNYDTSGTVGFDDLLVLAQNYGRAFALEASPIRSTAKRERAHLALELI